jgi:hypothetical protein
VLLACALPAHSMEQRSSQPSYGVEDPAPANLRLFLTRSYARYIFVQWCNQVRDGYLVVYVNESEAKWAKRAINAIQTGVTEQDSSIDTKKLWDEAWSVVRRTMNPDRDTCQFQLTKLVNQSGINVFKIEKPYAPAPTEPTSPPSSAPAPQAPAPANPPIANPQSTASVAPPTLPAQQLGPLSYRLAEINQAMRQSLPIVTRHCGSDASCRKDQTAAVHELAGKEIAIAKALRNPTTYTVAVQDNDTLNACVLMWSASEDFAATMQCINDAAPTM